MTGGEQARELRKGNRAQPYRNKAKYDRKIKHKKKDENR